VWATKRWPYYAELATQLVPAIGVVVVGSAADTPLAQEIIAAAGDRVLDATGRLTLLGSAELIGRAAAIVTNDSAPQHLASAMGTPTIAVFGPTVPEFGFGPLAPKATVAGLRDLPCRPCDRHGPQRCPLRHWRCMREITAGHVAELLHDLLPLLPVSPPSL
jgi:heptosyltransferase-2